MEQRIVICGAGALGSNLADLLVRQGATRLRVIDHDRVEQQNVATQIYAMAEVGQGKVEALRKHLFRVANVEIEAVRKELTAANAKSLLKGAQLIVDCFDNTAARQVVQDQARAANVPTVHVGLFADYGEVIWDPAYRVPRDAEGDVCEEPLARTLIVMTVAVAAETIRRFFESGVQENRSMTLGDLKISVMDS